MAEEEKTGSFSEKEDGTSQSKDIYIPEEPTPDVSISLLDIQIPSTPESSKGQISDGDTSRLESPKTVKPVLGKLQAKKRLMAFANKFKVLPKSQIKSNLSQNTAGILKVKHKAIQDDTNINRSRKKTEEKILAIEEIRREESKSKMLLAEAMAAACMEDENHISRNTANLLQNRRRMKNKYDGIKDSHRSTSKSTTERKYSERHRHRRKTERDSSTRKMKERIEDTERFTRKSSQNRDKHEKKKKNKDDRHRRDTIKMDVHRNKKEEAKDKKEIEKDKQEEIKEKREEIKNKKENQNNLSEMEMEYEDMKETDKEKEKELMQCTSWAKLRKTDLSLDDIIQLRRRSNIERDIKNRTGHDYARYLEQMLMLNNYRLKRQAFIAEGLDGRKNYPPESIKITKRGKGPQLLYCENPRISLSLSIPQLLQTVTPERREKIREIYEASSPRTHTEDIEKFPEKRSWYQRIEKTNYKDTKWETPIQFPKSKWDSEDEETTSVNVEKEKIGRSINQLDVSLNEQEEKCFPPSNVSGENKDDNTENIKGNIEFSENTINDVNNETSASVLLQSPGDEKLVSEYEQFMKMVCTDASAPTVTDVEYSPKKNAVKAISPCSYHNFNIESNLVGDKNFKYVENKDISHKIDNTSIDESLKEKFEKRSKLQTLENSIKSIECEDSTLSIDSQTQLNENIELEHSSNNKSEDSKSIPSDWENVRIKVERLSDENTEPKKVKKSKKRKKVMLSSDSSSSTSSSESEKERKKKKRKRKMLSNSSSDSDSTDSSSSSSSDSSSSDEKRKRRRKKKKIEKKKKRAKHSARIKKKRRKQMSTDSSSSDSNEQIKKKKKGKKKKKNQLFEARSNNIDVEKMLSKSPASSLDQTTLLQSMTPTKKIEGEITIEDKKRNEIISTRKMVTNVNIHEERMKHRQERKENKTSENFIEAWEMDSVITTQQNDDNISIQEHIEELREIDKDSEKDKYRKKRKYDQDNNEQGKERLSKTNKEIIPTKPDEEIETKKKIRREKDIKNSTEFLTAWEGEDEHITPQIIPNEAKISKIMGKQKKEKWRETDFDTLNVLSLTQLEKEVSQRHLLADEWEVDSLEAISDLTSTKRKYNQNNTSKKIEKEVKYDKKTDTYIAIEKESAREMRKRQERLCAIRIWEEEQEEGEREEMLLLKEKSKRKSDDWDIEEESFLCKNNEEIEICKVDDIIKIEKEWTMKPDDDVNTKEDSNNLMMKLDSKRTKKNRWDMGSQSEEKSETKDIWEEEYEWSKINKYEQKLGKSYIADCSLNKDKIKKEDSDMVNHSDHSDLIDFCHRKLQDKESMEELWESEETIRLVQTKKENTLMKHLVPVQTSEEQIASTKGGHPTKSQHRKILEAKYQEGITGLYSPSSPALSQKSQDIEASNDSSFSNPFFNEKRNKETLLTMEETVSTASIPLQLTKLRDTKHTSQKIGNILDLQSEDKISMHKFDIKNSDNLFDDLSINGPEADNSKDICMDIFAEYESRKLYSKQYPTRSDTTSINAKEDEMNESKTALKLIPKQLLIRRANEQAKSKRILEASLEDPLQHAAALLTIQKKLLESHALKNDDEDLLKDESLESFKCKHIATDDNEIIEKENYDKENKNDDIRKFKPCTSRNLSPISTQIDIRSPIREQKKRSPNRKENEKRYLHDKNKKERRSDDAGKYDRRENKSSKSDFTDNRRRVSPSRERKRRNGSPYTSWERQKSGSRSPGHSWSRSHSKSPKRKDDRKRKRDRYDDERSGRSRTDERRERYVRSPPRSNYNEDNFRKHGSKGNRDDWNRRRHDSTERDREKDTKYDQEIFKERIMEAEKYRDNRFRAEGDTNRALWQYENDNVLREANESMDSYMIGQDLSLDYNNRSYYKEGSLERDIMQDSPQSRYRKRSNARRERQWESDKDSSDLEHHGHFMHRLDKMSRNQTPPRARHSPIHQTLERFRGHSRSWSRSRSRTRSRSRSKSRTRSRSDSRSRALRTSSRSPSPEGRRIEIIQLGVTSGTNMLDSEMGINSMDTTATNFQYSNDIENENRYYYTENNLTYPPCIDESTTSSPKRLSLDDRLELELGIKKPHGKDSTSEYSSNFNTNVIAYPSPPPQQQQQMMYRQQPTVVQVGNVLQVVPADFNGMQTMRRETTATTTPSTVHGSSQVVRVGNVLQVVPTSLDWSSSQSSTVDQSNTLLHSTAVPTPSSISSVPLSIPVPVPVPLPVPPAIPSSTMSPASLPLPVPVPVPVPVPATAFPRNEVPPQKIAQPVYNYEAILEYRRKEREERKRLREARRKEKERRKIERTNRRALRQLEKNSIIARQTGGIPLDHRKGSIVDPSVLKALREGEEQDEEQTKSSAINPEKEEEEATTSLPLPTEEDEDPAVEEDEDEDEDEPEIEDDEEEEEEAEDEDEDDDEDEEKTSQANQQTEIDEAPIVATDATLVPTISAEIENKEWLELPPPPLKGILVAPGFRDAVSNGDVDDLMDVTGGTEDISDKDEEVDQSNECDRDVELDSKSGTFTSLAKSKSKLMLKKKKNKKSVQFADGIKPGEGTSPSGGEGDMPSPPPPTGVSLRDGFKELRRRDMKTSSRKSRKQEKRTRPPKTKKKVKVKIIKLKKPRVTPLAAMMMDDSDELDDRSPPPPPPGSPPPPHLWPSYLSIYNTAIRTIEQPQITSTLTPVQAPPPPTPLPLLVPPPPLNYTIQPCSKA